MKHELSVVWLRRDLRLQDNAALSRACAESNHVVVMFVFDSKILSKLKSKSDQRVTFIYESVLELNEQLKKQGSQLVVKFGDPTVEVPKFAKKIRAQALFFNEDYEPAAKKRDEKVRLTLKDVDIKCCALKDQVIFSGNEINKSDGGSYKMFTPYKNAWLKKISAKEYSEHVVKQNKFLPSKSLGSAAEIPSLKQIGFERATQLGLPFGAGRRSALKALAQWTKNVGSYHANRDYPAVERGTSGLSVHLRFGTLSIRECVRACMKNPTPGSRVWLSELIWREFYQMILDRFPYVVGGSFKGEYDKIKWLGSEANFKAWCAGETGFPIVDAGMRQLNQTGWMHNRLRMITASFLVKDLLIDWRKGESYFAEKLLDFDLSANNGGWQWCASTGCDSQPYFRIFNPALQSKKFDPECTFIKKWVPELRALSAREIHALSMEGSVGGSDHARRVAGYPLPVVAHSQQKFKALAMYRGVRK